MRVDLLDARIPWLGAHSGYDGLTAHLADEGVDARLTRCRTSPGQIRLGRFYGRIMGWPERRDFVSMAGELRFAMGARLRRPDVRHILYGEAHHQAIARRNGGGPPLVATLHHPPEQWGDWPDSLRQDLSRLDRAIVLYRRDVDRFEEIVGPGRVDFVPHGLDTEFFRPGEEPVEGGPRLLYAGQNGRDPDMLRRVVERLSARDPSLRVDVLVRAEIRAREPALRALAGHRAVSFHEGLDDEELREAYQRASLVLLPLRCCGAVNTILEALGCGRPVLTTDVGGVRDYGGGDVFPVVPAGDVDAMVDAAELHLGDAALRRDVGRRGRAFAEATLAWPAVAARHVDVYRSVL